MKLFIFMYKVEKSIHPLVISNMLIKNEDVHSLNTRYKTSFRAPLYKSIKAQRNISYRGVMCFNCLSSEID